ncbi:hypothetical protein HDU81_002971 [Chytriomyces hyalinus]|nr:hypothetical protein HDU81_002971 [Chytriomyces hyalinus]
MSRKQIDVDDLLRDLELSLNEFGGEPEVAPPSVAAAASSAQPLSAEPVVQSKMTVEAALTPVRGAPKPISGTLQWVSKSHHGLSADPMSRFLVLNGHTVNAFASSEPGETLLDEFAITQNTVAQNAPGLSLAFELSGSHKNWILQSTTIASKATWLNSIKNAIKTAPAEEEVDDTYDVLADYGEDEEQHVPHVAQVAETQAPQPREPSPMIPQRLESHNSESSPGPQQFPPVPFPSFPPPSPGAPFSPFPPSFQQVEQQQQMNFSPPTTQPQQNQPYSYAAFQTPPSRLPPSNGHQSPVSPTNDAYLMHRRGSASNNSVRSYAGSTVETINSSAAANEEVSALRQELERAKQELQDQMRMNKELVSNHRAAASSPRLEQPAMARSESKLSTAVETASYVKDKSDTASMSSQKSGKSTKSTGGGWFGRSKSQTKEKTDKDKEVKKKKSALAAHQELAIMSGMMF